MKKLIAEHKSSRPDMRTTGSLGMGSQGIGDGHSLSSLALEYQAGWRDIAARGSLLWPNDVALV